MQVTKRNGEKAPLDIEKMHRVVAWACEGFTNVSASEIELRSKIQFYDGIKTSDIQETLIKAAADLISEDTPNYQYVAGRLINYHIRKDTYGSYNIPSLYYHVSKVTQAGYYDPELLQKWYTKQAMDKLDTFIDHDRDFDIVYVGMEQMRGKYLIKNRVTGKIHETPQMAFMLIAMTLYREYEDPSRTKMIRELYDAVSRFDISLPTPVMAGLRSPQKQFSSCVLIESDDSLDSINATTAAIVKYVSQKAGIGIGAGRIRAIGSPIRSGDATHTGVIPFYRLFQAAVKSCSQGGVRSGAATLYFPAWHLEFEDIVVLKNNKGTENNRIRHMDYGVQFNKVMYERLLSNGDITLFSPSDVPEMYDAFFVDTDLFRKLYEEAEANPSIRKKTLRAVDLFSMFMQERKDTGRVYLMNVDHANDHGSFIKELAPVRMSNLCCVSGDTLVTILVDGRLHTMTVRELIEGSYWHGARIMCKDLKLGTIAYKEIQAISRSPDREMMRVSDTIHRLSVKVTPDHPFYVLNAAFADDAGNVDPWIRADELLYNDILETT